MASGNLPVKNYGEKIWPIIVELTAIVNESLHERSGLDCSKGDFAERVQKQEDETLKEDQETSETQRKHKETTEALRTKDKELKDSFDAFVFHTKQAQSEIARLKTNCERLQKEKQLTEHQKGAIFSQLSCDIKEVEQQRNAYAEHARDLQRLWWDSKVQTNELETQVTDIQVTLGQRAEKYRRKVRSLAEDLRDEKNHHQKELLQERTMHGSVLAAKEAKLRVFSEKNCDLEKDLREEKSQNSKLQNEVTVLKHQLDLAEKQRECAETGQALVGEDLQDSRRQIKELEHHLAKATSHVQEVSDQALQLESERQALQRQLQNAIEQLHQSQTSVEASRAEKTQLQEEITSHERGKKALEVQISEVEQRAESQVKGLELRLLSSQAELKKLVRLEESEKYKGSVESQRVRATEKKLEDCTRHVNELKDQLTIAEGNAKDVLDEASKLKRDREVWQEKAVSSQGELTALKPELEMLRKELSDLKQQPDLSTVTEQFKIYVKIMKDGISPRQIDVCNRVKRSDTVAKVKQEIFKDTGIPVELQSVKFGRHILRDDKTFLEYNIPSHATLGLMTQEEEEPIYESD